jgi:tRNA (mo5U34)-methyltransferase
MSESKMTIEDRREAARKLVTDHPNWYHRIEVYPGVITPGVNDTQKNIDILDRIGLPKDVRGKRVLDVGAADGAFSFLMEQRGAAEVVAVDYRAVGHSGFQIAARLLGSQAQYHVDNVYNLSREKYGEFDIILFLGVLYHLRNPLLAMDTLRALARPGAKLFVETHLIDNYVQLPDGSSKPLAELNKRLVGTPLWQFFPRDTLNKDATNKWAPNMAGLKALVEEASFGVMATDVYSTRGFLYAQALEDDKLTFFRTLDSGAGW